MTLEELEIVVKANVQDATKKLESLKAQMDGTGANFQDISKEADNMTMKVSKSGVGFKNFGEVAKSAGKTLAKYAPAILAVVGAVLSLKKVVDTLKKVFSATFKILKGVGKSVLTGTIKLLQGIGTVARNVASTLANLTSKGIKNLVQASSSLNNAMSELYGKTIQLGNALASVVAPIIQAIEPLISSILDTMINLANYIAQVTASLFGNTTTFKKATKVTTDYAKSVEKANGQLAKFDELNVLEEKKSGGAETAPADMFEETKISKEVLDYTQKIKDKLEEVKNLLKKGNFRGAGDVLGKFINDEISNIPAYDIAQKIANKINDAMSFINGFLSNNPLGTVGRKLGEFIKGMIDTIDPEEVGEFIANVINNAVSFVHEFLKAKPFDNLGRKIATTLVTMTEKIDSKEIGRTIANVIMTAVDLVLDFVKEMNAEDGWRKIGEWITNGLNEMVYNLKPEDIAEAISGFVLGLLDLGITFFETADWEEIGRKIYETLKNIPWGEIIIKIIRFICSTFGALAQTIFGILSGIVEDIVNWIKTDVKDSILNAVNSIIEFIFGKEAAANLKKSLKIIWQGLTLWWEEKKRIFKQGGIKAVFKSIFNDIIGVVETAVNYIIKKINTLRWEVPDWVPGIGGSIWGFNFNTITIPRLADGGVLTKPTPVLAGEYAGASSNPEIVAPQSLMYETNMKANVPVINAIEEMSDNIIDAFKTIGVYADFGYDKLRVGLEHENYRAGEKLYGI